MARSYANIFCAIWDDDDFCGLSSDAQRTYFMLVTQDDITACGTLALRLRRWAKTLPAKDQHTLDPAIKELVAEGFAVIDEEYEELLVRTFAKHDGGYKHSQRVKAVIGYAEAIKSPSLRTAMAVELRKLGVESALDSLLTATGQPLECHLSPTGQAPGSGRSVVTEVVTTPLHTPQPQTTLLDPAAKPQRATRINEWQPSPADIEWARSQRFADEFSRYETTKFSDYWRAKSGRDATKTDWPATWRNWLRRAAEQNGGGRASPGATPATAKAQGWLDIGNELRQTPQAIEGATA